MTEGSISKQIIQAVRSAAGTDSLVQEFLLQLLFMEGDRGRQWKDVYRRQIHEYTVRRGTGNENR